MNRAFYRHTIVRLMARTAKELTVWFAALFGAGLKLWYDADQVAPVTATGSGRGSAPQVVTVWGQ